MINLKELYNALKNIGIPVRYRVFKTTPDVPFLVYYEDSSDNISADGIAYFPRNEIVVELYAAEKNKALEKKIENALKEVSVYWEKTESYIESEKLLLTAYYLIVKGENDE